MSTNTTNWGMGKAADGDNAKTYLETTLGAALDKVDAHDHSNDSKGLKVTRGDTMTITNGLILGANTPALTMPGQQGGVAKAITWGDLGAGITSILGNTVGSAPLSNVLRFDIATGTAAGSATALTLDGSGGMKSGVGDVVLGAGTGMSNSATAGYVYIAGGGGASTGVPASNASGFAIRYNSSTNTIQVYNGAWRSTAALS